MGLNFEIDVQLFLRFLCFWKKVRVRIYWEDSLIWIRKGENGDVTRPRSVRCWTFKLLQQGHLPSVGTVHIWCQFRGQPLPLLLLFFWRYDGLPSIQTVHCCKLLCTVYCVMCNVHCVLCMCTVVIRWWNSVLERERIKRRRRARTLYSRLSKSPRGSWATTRRIRVGYVQSVSFLELENTSNIFPLDLCPVFRSRIQIRMILGL